MKKIFIYIIFILFSSNISASAQNYKWTKIVTTSDDSTVFYLDKNTVRNVGSFHYFWMLSDYLKLTPDDDPNIRSNITYNILNCKNKEYKMISYTSFSGNKARGAVDIDIIVPEIYIESFQWRHYGEGTSFGEIFKVVCR